MEKGPKETYIELRILRTISRIKKKNGGDLHGIKKRFSSQQSSAVVVVSGVLVRMVSRGVIGGVGVGGAGGVPTAVTVVVVLPPLLSLPLL